MALLIMLTIGFVLLASHHEVKAVIQPINANISSLNQTLPQRANVLDSVNISLSSLNQTLPQRAIVLDSSGIPFLNYGGSIGLQRNPLQTAQTALEYYDYFKKNDDEKSKLIFLNNADWLVHNAISRGNYSLLEYHFPFSVPYPPSYTMKPPWYSGISQGFALPVLANAFQITGDKKYLDSAKMLLNSFFVQVKDGGVTYKTAYDGWWYEEYPITGGKLQPRVLNGMMFAALGIYDYYNSTRDNAAKYLFDQGVLALKENLPQYDHKGSSYYDLLTHSFDPFYHKIHVKLLSQLYNITKESIFKVYHDKWQNLG